MSQYKIKGYIVSSTPYHEQDRVLKVYTEEHGLVSVIGKGSKKLTSAQNARMAVGNLVDIAVYRKTEQANPLATTITVISTPTIILRDFQRSLMMMLFCTTFSRSIPDAEPDVSLYRFFDHYMKMLQEHPPAHWWIYAWCWQLTSLLGNGIPLTICPVTDKPITQRGFYSYQREVILASAPPEERGIWLDDKDLAVLTMWRKGKEWDKMPVRMSRNLINMLKIFLPTVLDVRLYDQYFAFMKKKNASQA